jgi:hypothetical protein
MSTRSDRDERRAEARRRARLAARGEPPADEETEPEEAERPARGGFLTTLFPPAPPLPNRPDPLASFEASGPLRPVRERAFLLGRNLPAWVVTGILAFVGYLGSAIYGNTLLGLLGNFVLFGSLIAAGWFGWQRPTLFGTAASLLSFVLVTAFVLVSFGQQGAGPETFGSTGEVVGSLALRGLYQAGLGFLGGWYGGYLRRRQTQLSAGARRRR